MFSQRGRNVYQSTWFSIVADWDLQHNIRDVLQIALDLLTIFVFNQRGFGFLRLYEGKSISKLQIVIEKKLMEIMTYKQHLFFNVIPIQIYPLAYRINPLTPNDL
jgi:hypothetical protein